MSSLKETNIVKLENFVRVDYRTWKEKMLFFLTTLNMACVISTPRPGEKEDDTVEAILFLLFLT